VALAGRREWTGLAVLALACLLYAMDLTVLHLAVPSLSEDQQPSSAPALVLALPGLGGVLGFAALSTSPEMLIASRALLGIAGATLACRHPAGGHPQPGGRGRARHPGRRGGGGRAGAR